VFYTLSSCITPPAEPAVAAFFSTLRDADDKPVDRVKFTEEFLKEWQLRKTPDQRKFFMEQFTKRYSNWDAALAAFKAEYGKISQEPLDRETASRETLFAQLGAPRDMDGDPGNLAAYTEEYTESLRKLLSDKGVVIDPPAVGYFTFSAAGLPTNVGDFQLVATQLDIIGELVRRIGASGVTTLSDFRIGALGGTESGSFRKYRYAFEVVGTMASIRNLVRLIDSISTPRRMFVVKTVSLYAMRDDAQPLFDDDAIKTGGDGKDEVAPAREAGGVPADKEAAKKLEEERAAKEKREAQRAEMLKKLPFYQRPSYGDVAIGLGEECKAVICVDYITLAGGR